MNNHILDQGCLSGDLESILFEICPEKKKNTTFSSSYTTFIPNARISIDGLWIDPPSIDQG